jgi:hypothetical protein
MEDVEVSLPSSEPLSVGENIDLHCHFLVSPGEVEGMDIPPSLESY